MAIAAIHLLDLVIRLTEEDDRNVYHIRKHGYEPSSLQLWAELIKPDMTVVDVGAYTGLYSMIAALRGAYVVALEPMPANFWRLGVNAALNKVLIRELRVAASDHDGEVTLHYNPHVPLTTGASLEPGVTMHSEDVRVRCVRIDSLHLTNVAAIKIDVERHEPAVLRGAMQTIERDRPVLLIETLDAAMREEVARALPRYECAAILDSRNTLFTPK